MDKLTQYILPRINQISLLKCCYSAFISGMPEKSEKKASWKTCKQGECQSPIKCTNALWWIESAIKQAADNMQLVWLPK